MRNILALTKACIYRKYENIRGDRPNNHWFAWLLWFDSESLFNGEMFWVKNAALKPMLTAAFAGYNSPAWRHAQT